MQRVQDLKTTRMEWQYYTNKAKKRKIDQLLQQAAQLFANCENTPQARQEAKRKEKTILEMIAKYDKHFAESCGWEDPNRVDEDSEPESVLRLQALDAAQEIERRAS